jgi:uncharacterized protein YukE
MSGSVVHIDPQALGKTAASIASIAESMAGELQQLESAVTGSGNPWGGDETGTIFSAIYMKILSHSIESLASYVEQVGYAGAQLARHARAHAEHDATAASMIERAGSGQGATP